MSGKKQKKQSDYIKHLRGKLTQKEFSEKVGVTQQTVSRYENETTEITLKRFLKWCDKTNHKICLEKK